MKCAKCGKKSEVYSTQGQPDRVLRRRRCISCHHKWHTQEVAVDRPQRKKIAKPVRQRSPSVRQRHDRTAPLLGATDQSEAREILIELGSLPRNRWD